MRVKGISYDIGISFGDYQASLGMDTTTMRRELDIIKNDLHLNAIRLSGTNAQNMVSAARIAFEQGLDVWISPHYIDAEPEEIIKNTVECAALAEELRKSHPERELVFVTGCEFTVFAKGFMEANTFMERIIRHEEMYASGKSETFKKFTGDIARAVKEVFKGKVTYASEFWEEPDWEPYDIIGLDFYRDANTRPFYNDFLKSMMSKGKPFAQLEFGLACFKGAKELGAGAFMIVDQSDPADVKLNGDYERCEKEQADELVDLLALFDELGVESSFIFNFAASGYPHREDPKYDLDMGCFGLVKSYENKMGTVYPDMKWDPKEAFYAVAEYYKNH